MKSLKFIYFAAIFLTIGMVSKAQFANDVIGRPLLETKYTNIKGTPFYNEDYLKGLVKMKGNAKYTPVLIKFDFVAEAIIVKKDANASPIELVEKVDDFKIINVTGDTTTFRSVPNENGYFQVVYPGKYTLLKKTKKRISETTAYNSATVEKTINTVVYYYVLNDKNELSQTKLDKKSFAQINPSKAKQVEEYINQEKINFKVEADVQKLMQFINQ